MKLKRILAGIIACTMVATAMGVTAFAADTEPTDVVTTTETEILAGDIDDNGKVNMQDAVLLSRYLVAGDEEAKANFAQLMELNLDAVKDENGDINITSVINVLKEAIKTIPVETTPEETTVDTDETTVDTDETTVDTDETTVDTDETTVDTDETTVDTDETTVDTDETTVDTDETTVDTDETTVDTDETTTETTPVVTEDPELVESAKADLDDAIEIGDVERLNEDYTEDSWEALDAALKAAKAVKEDATIAEIVAATEALTAAINGLVTDEEELANAVSVLRDTLDAANAKVDAENEEDPYTYDSLIELEAAIDDAVDVLYDFDNEIDVIIEDVIEATDNLNVAIANIKTESEELKEAGNALKADIAAAKKYIALSRTVGEVDEEIDSALEIAIADAEALFTRTGRLNADTTIDMVLEANDDLVDSLETVINDAWTKTIKADDGSIVLEQLNDQVALAVELGLYTYKDVYTLTGLKLTAEQTEALAKVEADKVDGFYKDLLIDTNTINADSITGLSKIYQAFNTKATAAAKTAKASAKADYDSAYKLADETNKYTEASITKLVDKLDTLEDAYYDLDDSIIEALTLSKGVKGAVSLLVTNASAEAAEAALDLIAALGLEDVDGYADFIVMSKEAGKETYKISFKAKTDYTNSKIIGKSAQRDLISKIQAAYDSVLDGVEGVKKAEIDTTAQDVNATTLNAANKSLTASLLDARKACYTSIKAEYDAYIKTLTTIEKSIPAVKTAIQDGTDITKGIGLKSIAADYKEATDKIKIIYGKTIPVAIKELAEAIKDLNAEITTANGLIVENTEDGVAVKALKATLSTAVNTAKTALTSTDKTVVTGATGTLNTAIDTFNNGLEAAKLADAIDALKAAIKEAEAIKEKDEKDNEIYTTETWDPFAKALADAEALFEDGKLVAGKTVSDVTGATTALTEAQGALAEIER